MRNMANGKLLWGLLRIPARGSTAAPEKGHAAIGREECIRLTSRLITLLGSTATTQTQKAGRETKRGDRVDKGSLLMYYVCACPSPARHPGSTARHPSNSTGRHPSTRRVHQAVVLGEGGRLLRNKVPLQRSERYKSHPQADLSRYMHTSQGLLANKGTHRP